MTVNRPRILLLAALLAGCASTGERAALEPYLGLYRGSFASALTEDPEDDLNFNPCDPRSGPCLTHHRPLRNVLLELRASDRGAPAAQFFLSAAEREAGRTLDLLGAGCGTRIGDLQRLETHRGPGSLRHTLVFPLTAENRLCLGKLRPTSTHAIHVELHEPTANGAAADTPSSGRFARVVIDKRVTDENYLFVVEDGVRRRVRIDLENRYDDDGRLRYRVCIENDFGEYDRCVLTDREFRRFAIPVPVPGGVAVNYTWWQELSPQLRRTRGRFAVERYTGRFDPVAAP